MEKGDLIFAKQLPLILRHHSTGKSVKTIRDSPSPVPAVFVELSDIIALPVLVNEVNAVLNAVVGVETIKLSANNSAGKIRTNHRKMVHNCLSLTQRHTFFNEVIKA